MRLFFIILFSIIYADLSFSQTASALSNNSDTILNHVSEKLRSLQTLRYTNTRELNYASNNYHYISKWTGFYDFESNDSLIGFKYQVEDSATKDIFNGTEYFTLNKKAKTIEIIDHPQKDALSAFSVFYNSIITFRNVLPLLILDKTLNKSVADTSISGTAYILITINMGKKRIQYLGNGFDAMTTPYDLIYKIAVQKNTYLPYEVLQRNAGKDFIKTTFENIEIKPAALPKMSWYYSTFMNDYAKAVDTGTLLHLLPVGSMAPGWNLKSYNNNRIVSLTDLKGKVILLDFWIKNCGACIESSPHLNDLQTKFGKTGFEIVSINSYDSKEDVNWFCNKYDIKYPVVINGEAVAKNYGVSAFPTFLLINKAGKIIYVQDGYDSSVKREIERLIQNSL